MLVPLLVATLLQQAPVCAGRTVSAIDVRTHPPSAARASERAVDALTEVVGLDEQRTPEDVIRAYLRIRPGQRCTLELLAESERMLRAQPFVASVSVRGTADGAGRVRIRVDVVDEVPWVGGLRLKGARIRGVDVGTRNARGTGLTLIGGVENGFAYRDGVKVTVGQYGALGRPAFAALTLHRRPLGGLVEVSLSEPYYTAGQRTALQAGFAQEVEYGTLVRAGADDAAARVRRTSYSAGVVQRVGRSRSGRAFGLGGLLVMGTDVRTTESLVIPTDTGLVGSTDATLVGRFPNYAVGRVALAGGIRSLRFRRVSRFETLLAEQDVGEGVEVQMLVGPRLGDAGFGEDLLLASDLYVGLGGPRSFGSLHVRAEGRHFARADEWRGVVGNAQLTWYLVSSSTRTRTFTASAAAVDRSPLPVQLTLRDPIGGVLGLPESSEAGGRRVAVRIEQRHLTTWFRPRAAVALGVFADAGQVWAGDVVFGTDSPVRGSVGFSFFATVPSTGKRVYRLDLGVPVNPESGKFGVGVRLSSGDRTGGFWAEPGDVARAREGRAPPALSRW